MMKFKTKKQVTLPRLIEWAWDNGIKHKEFTGSRNGIVEFDFRGWVRTDLIEPDEIFEVEVEEEITEETVIPLLLEVYEYDESLHMHLNKNLSIKAVLDESLLDKSLNDLLFDPRAFHILNDDMTMTLIWRDGELVK